VNENSKCKIKFIICPKQMYLLKSGISVTFHLGVMPSELRCKSRNAYLLEAERGAGNVWLCMPMLEPSLRGSTGQIPQSA